MGEEKFKSQKKKNQVWGMKNVKVKRKRKKKREWNMNHLLNIVEKEKDDTKLYRMKERPNMNFWPMYYVLCKEFWKVVLYESYYVSKLYEIYGTFVLSLSFYSLTTILSLGPITTLNKDILIYEVVWSK